MRTLFESGVGAKGSGEYDIIVTNVLPGASLSGFYQAILEFFIRIENGLGKQFGIPVTHDMVQQDVTMCLEIAPTQSPTTP